MNVLPLKMMFMRRPVLIISKVMSEKEERVFLKVVKLGPSCAFPKTEVIRKP